MTNDVRSVHRPMESNGRCNTDKDVDPGPACIKCELAMPLGLSNKRHLPRGPKSLLEHDPWKVC